MTDDDLLDALELGSLALPWLPGKAERMDIPGVLARTTEISSPYVNLVSMVRLAPENADGVIERICAHFRSRAHAFAWITSPRSQPTDVAERLQRAGLSHFTGYSGLACTDLAAPIAAPDGAIVEEIDVGSIADLDRVKAAAFGMPLAAAHWIDELLLTGVGGRVRAYLARSAGDATWTAFGQSWYAPNAPIVILGGGGVVPEARGRGLFRALVKRRMEDARADGIRAATMQAMDATSAPIMKRLGFSERAHMDMWAWSPPA